MGTPWVTPVQAQSAAHPRANSAPAPAGVVQSFADWLKRANREYQDNVLKELSVPTGRTASGETASRAGERGGVADQIKSLLGLDAAPPPDPAAIAAAREHEAGLTRQVEARKLEQERNAAAQRLAEQQKLAAEAKRAAEFDVVTRQSQKTAELARVAEEERRKRGTPPADEKAPIERKVAAAASQAVAEKAESDRRIAAAVGKAANEKAAEDRKIAAAADKVAAEKLASARKAAEIALNEGKARERAAAEKAAEDRKTALAAEKAAAERAANERKAAAAAEKAALDKAANERRVAEKAAADKANNDRKAAEAAAVDAAKRSKTAVLGEKPDRRTVQAVASHPGVDAAPKRAARTASRHGNGGRCSRAGQDVEVPAIYVVKSGDTLWDISRRYYDKGARFERIVRANASKIGSPDLIYPCQKFYLPGRHAFFLIIAPDAAEPS